MFKLLLLYSLFTFVSAETHVYSGESIQDAIDGAPSGETIIVHDGAYVENLVIEKDIILRSENGAGSTIIDGSMDRGLGSTVVIRPESNSSHKPIVEIDGFGITGGKGTDIVNKTITLSNGNHPIEKVGGGIFIYVNTPKINNCEIISNGDNNTDKGGGVFAVSDTEDSDFLTRDDYVDSDDLESAEGTLDLYNNVFLYNVASSVNSIYVLSDDYVSADLSSGYYDVYVENINLAGSSEYWIKSSGTILDLSNGEGENTAILDTAYVSPNGSDLENDGLSWASPFQTVNHAITQVYADSLNPATIYLSSGTFSPSTSGESFPINMVSYVNLLGQGEEVTILDAEQIDRVILLENSQDNRIQKLTITGGGLGVDMENSNPLINNVTIRDNDARGMSVMMGSQPILEYVTISGNLDGGLYVTESDPTLNFVNITNNIAHYGAGIYMRDYNYDAGTFSNVIVSQNEATFFAGGMYIEIYSHPTFNNVTISKNRAPSAAGILIMLYSNPIFNNVIISENIGTNDIWKSSIDITDGSNPIFNNVTISGNNGRILLWNTSHPTFINTIFFNNGLESIYIHSPQSNGFEDENLSMPIISYSNIEGGWEGEGNIDADPLFVDSENGDYSLQENSPCIDAGTADLDGDGQDDITDYFGDAPDMGAYEFEGSSLIGDLNGDGQINVQDVVALVNIILGAAPEVSSADYNGDGLINVLDVVEMVTFILRGND